MDNRSHWEGIYENKSNQEMSWFQENHATSLEFLKTFSVPKDAQIIDIGGGDSLFVDYALRLGYENITVLDISEKAIHRAKHRLGPLAEKATWIVADVTEFNPTHRYDFWHDRAVFHFLTNESDIQKYLTLIGRGLHEDGIFIIGTFSEKGPEKCSGLPIRRYNEQGMTSLFESGFQKVKCFEETHTTPFHTVQAFLFCSFKRLAA